MLDETNMAWGIFNKIGKGLKQGFDFVKDKALPVVSKIIDVAKPMISGTKYGKYMDKIEGVKDQTAKYVGKTDHVVNAFKGAGGRKMMPQLKFEDLDEGDEEEDF